MILKVRSSSIILIIAMTKGEVFALNSNTVDPITFQFHCIFYEILVKHPISWVKLALKMIFYFYHL
jgi:hypothetical protein